MRSRTKSFGVIFPSPSGANFSGSDRAIYSLDGKNGWKGGAGERLDGDPREGAFVVVVVVNAAL